MLKRIARIMPPWMWLVVVILYVLIPVDLFPDFLGLPGRLDDFVVALAGLWFMRSGAATKMGAGGESRGREKAPSGKGREGEDNEARKTASRSGGETADPYEVLGVVRGTPIEEVRRQYRQRILHYHPDRVEHLGPEFGELAEERTRELNRAFKAIELELGGRG